MDRPDIISISGQTYSVFGKLGEGRYAVVYGARDNTGSKLAVKKSSVQEQEDLTSCKTEIEIMKKIQHKNILKCVGSEVKKHGAFFTITMLMPFAPHGNLVSVCNSKLQSNSKLSEKTILKMILDTSLAVAELHGQRIPISHRDLKAENILSFPDLNFKLCDFGSTTTYSFSCATGRDMTLIEEDLDTKTTLAYRAPEQCDLVAGNMINQCVDNWALGVVLYFLCFFDCPFQESSVAISSCQYSIPNGHNYSVELISLIPWMLERNVDRRPTASEIAQRTSEMLGKPSWSSNVKQVVGTQPRHPKLAPPKEAKPQQAPVQQKAKPKSAGGLFGMLDWSDNSGGAVAQQPAQPQRNGNTAAPVAQSLNFGVSATAGTDLFAQKPQHVSTAPQQQSGGSNLNDLFPSSPPINSVTSDNTGGTDLFPAVTNIDAMFSSPSQGSAPTPTSQTLAPGQAGYTSSSPSLDDLFSSPAASPISHLSAPTHAGHQRSVSDPVCAYVS